MESNRARVSVRWQIAVFVIALIARCAYVLVQHRWGLFFGGELPNADSRLYLDLADHVASGRGMASGGPIGWKESGYPFAIGPTAWVTPGYPLFLAASELVSGRNLLLIRLIQAVLGAVACVAVARIAAHIGTARAGVFAGLAAAVYYELVFATTAITTEAVYVFFAAVMLLAVVAALATTPSSASLFAGAGVLFGLAALVRPEAVGAAVAIGVAWVARRSDIPRAKRVLHAALLTGTCIAILVPWSIRNLVATGRPTLLSNESAYMLWLGNNPAYDAVATDFTRFGGYSPSAVFGRLSLAAGRSESEVSDIYLAAAVSHIVSEPWKWIARAPHKLWNMWRPVEIGTSPRHKVVAFTLYPILLAGAIAGIVIAARVPAAMPLLIFLAVNVALHAAVAGEMRYRIPLWIAAIPMFGVAMDRAFVGR